MNEKTKREAIDAIDWLHTMELHEYTTNGRYDWRPYLKKFIYEDLENKTALDIGAGDGFFSFEFEKMGAIVTALDLPSQDERDNSQFGVGNKKTPQRHQDSFTSAFMIAKEILESNVQHVTMNLYDLNSQHGEVFDVAFCNDVLLHLTDPFRALCAFRNVCKNLLVIGTPLYQPKNLMEMAGAYLLRRFPIAYFLGGGKSNAFWIPNERCLHDYVIGAGFRIKKTTAFKPARKHAEYAGLRGVIAAIPK